MNCAIEIRDDPDRPRGGHAIVMFRDVTLEATEATLAIESLTEGFNYRGPRRLEVPARATSQGLELAIGPDVVGVLKEGLAINLSIVGTTIGADVLWPVLTPLRIAPKRRALSSGPPRRVVVDGRDDAPRTNVDSASTSVDGETAKTPELPPRQTETVPSRTDDPTLAPLQEEAPSLPEPPQTESDATRHDGPYSVKSRAERQGWQPKAVAAVALAAFALGASATALVWLLAPAPRLEPQSADPTLPSPYLLLDDLADRSPNGTAVDVGDPAALRHRGDVATSEPEASFWRKWATRKLLDSRTNDAAAILSDFATDIATHHTTKPDLAAARFVWEMAAVAKDCAAMNNIASALDVAHATPDASATWRRRAESCRSPTSPGQ